MKQKSDFKEKIKAFEAIPEIKPKYCLYSRKSTESEERQVLSIDSQIKELFKIIDLVDVNELGLRHKLDDEIERFNRFQGHVLQSVGKTKIDAKDLDVRAYAKYVLREGSVSEKRELLGNLRSRLVYTNKAISLAKS